MKILVVDDDNNARVCLTDFLEAQGYAVAAASNGQEGLDTARASPPDIIFSDITMPEMDGFEFCRRVKSDEELNSVSFVFYTATRTEPEDRRLALELGASRFLVKPKKVDELVGEIRGVIKERQSAQELPTLSGQDATTLDGMHLAVVNRKLQKKIHELEQASRALKESEAVLKATLESIQDGVLVVSKDGAVSHCNARFSEMWSIPSEVMALRSDQKLIEFVLPQLAAPDEFVAKIEDCYLGSGAFADTLRLKDGRVFERISAPHVQDGRETGRVWFFRDVTERKRVEEVLRASEERFRAVFHQTFQLMGLFDLDGRLLVVNRTAQEMVGAEEKEMIGMPFWETPWWTHSPAAQARLKEAIKQASEGEWVQYETTHPGAEGREHIVDFSLRPIFGEGNRIVYLCAEGRDITDRKQVEAEREKLIAHLESQNSELEQFAYTVSHDLRTPLITINNYSGALRQDLQEGNTEQAKEDVDRIEAAGKAMYHLLNDVLELSRIGRVVAPPEDVPMTSLVREVLDLLASRISVRGVCVKTSDDLPVLYGDRKRLREVFQNLVENSIKYMGEQREPRVEIGARKDGDRTVCYVRDNGIGIEPQYYERVFGLFDQLDPRVDGSGIGLALVKRIVEVHDGRIWCESEGKGCGSTFSFSIPSKQKDVTDVI